MREALTNVNSDSERVPGSMGERMGKNKVSALFILRNAFNFPRIFLGIRYRM